MALRPARADFFAVSRWRTTSAVIGIVHGIAGHGDLRAMLQETPSVVAGWRRKCLQGAVLALAASASKRTCLDRAFSRFCANHWPSGGVLNPVAMMNLYVVARMLWEVDAHVKVLASRSEACFADGRYRGWWVLGHSAGTYFGALVWFEDDGHVSAVKSELGEHLLAAVGAAPSASVEPWLLFEAGAPKKSKRGGHFSGSAGAAMAAAAKAEAKAKSKATAPVDITQAPVVGVGATGLGPVGSELESGAAPSIGLQSIQASGSEELVEVGSVFGSPPSGDALVELSPRSPFQRAKEVDGDAGSVFGSPRSADGGFSSPPQSQCGAILMKFRVDAVAGSCTCRRRNRSWLV